MPEQHWYDPEISGSSLIFNLKNIMNKMIAYQAINYSVQEPELHTIERKAMSNKVFIVHGHDNAAIQEMARTLEKGGFEAIILHEQLDSGLTIIEKIERYADVDFAVVLYTECDLGRAKEMDQKDEKYRARQNVVFEHGYLIGKLGREHVCALVRGNVETPGDTVQHSLELTADSVIVDGPCEHQHICIVHFGGNFHGIVLDDAVPQLQAGKTALAEANLLFPQKHSLYLMTGFLRTLGKGCRQRLRISTLAGA